MFGASYHPNVLSEWGILLTQMHIYFTIVLQLKIRQQDFMLFSLLIPTNTKVGTIQQSRLCIWAKGCGWSNIHNVKAVCTFVPMSENWHILSLCQITHIHQILPTAQLQHFCAIRLLRNKVLIPWELFYN